MRLFTVEISYEIVVYAEDEGHALQVARDNAIEGMRDLSVYDLDMNARKYPEQGVPTDERIGDLRAPNAEVTGSPALSASPCGLPGYAYLVKGD